jgi:O-antigen/teichoic acid export membrane protein
VAADGPAAPDSLARLRGRAGARHIGLSAVDQALSSVSNVLAVVLVARSSSPDDFGRFTVVYAALSLVLSAVRAYFGNRISLAPDSAAARGRSGDVLGAVLWLSLLLAAVVGVTGVLAAGPSRVVLVVALATPLVCLQDMVRFGAIAQGRQGVAVVSDLVWTVCLVVALVLGGEFASWESVAVWAVGAALALVVGAALLRQAPRLRGGWLELRRWDPMSASLLYGRVAISAASFVLLTVVAAVLAPAAAGALRGARTLLGPVNSAVSLVGISLTPVLVRRPRAQDARAGTLLAAILIALVLAIGVVLLVIPDAWGEQLLGQSWEGAREVLPWTVLEYCVLCVTTALLLISRVRDAVRSVTSQQTVMAVLTLVAGVTAALVTRDVRWVAAALVVPPVASAATGLVQLRRHGVVTPGPGAAAS